MTAFNVSKLELKHDSGKFQYNNLPTGSTLTYTEGTNTGTIVTNSTSASGDFTIPINGQPITFKATKQGSSTLTYTGGFGVYTGNINFGQIPPRGTSQIVNSKFGGPLPNCVTEYTIDSFGNRESESTRYRYIYTDSYAIYLWTRHDMSGLLDPINSDRTLSFTIKTCDPLFPISGTYDICYNDYFHTTSLSTHCPVFGPGVINSIIDPSLHGLACTCLLIKRSLLSYEVNNLFRIDGSYYTNGTVSFIITEKKYECLETENLPKGQYFTGEYTPDIDGKFKDVIQLPGGKLYRNGIYSYSDSSKTLYQYETPGMYQFIADGSKFVKNPGSFGPYTDKPNDPFNSFIITYNPDGILLNTSGNLKLQSDGKYNYVIQDPNFDKSFLNCYDTKCFPNGPAVNEGPFTTKTDYTKKVVDLTKYPPGLPGAAIPQIYNHDTISDGAFWIPLVSQVSNNYTDAGISRYSANVVKQECLINCVYDLTNYAYKKPPCKPKDNKLFFMILIGLLLFFLYIKHKHRK
jgi:hypothetical protein